MSATIDHVASKVRDFDASKAFHERALAPLDYRLLLEVTPDMAGAGARHAGFKAAFPRHSRRVNEEMFYVIDGRGEVRIGDATHPIRAGDVIACPPGGPETAHGIVNTGDTGLKYLLASTKLSPELCEYPDSGKFGVLAELGTDPNGAPAMFRDIGGAADTRYYWQGE